MFPYRGQTALVTGASSGIGAEFARELARRGMSLILVARAEMVLNELASDLAASHNVAVDVIPADLSQTGAVEKVSKGVADKGLRVDLLVNNAGVMTYGPFEKIDPANDQAGIMVNVNSLVGLTHAFLPAMLERQHGGVINIASVAGFQPIPYLATYAATKAFVINFSVALWEECRHRNVHVMAMCPGTTRTELFIRGNAHEAALGTPRTVQQVVATALRGLERRRSIIVDGLKNSLLTNGPRFIPRWFAAKCAGQAVRPKRTDSL
jgi:Short-chain dehydrogenases of various substrate specificities